MPGSMAKKEAGVKSPDLVGEVISNFPEEKKKEYVNTKAQIKSALLLNPDAQMTRHQMKILDFLESISSHGELRERDEALDRGNSFVHLKTAISEGRKSSSQKKGDIF